MIKQVIFATLVVVFLVSCGSKEDEKANVNTDKKVVIETVSNKIVGIGKIVPENQIIQFASSVNGILDVVYKKENETFKKGEIIGMLKNDVETSQVNESSSKINIQNQEVKVAQAAISEYETKLDNALNQYKRLKSLLEKGAETKQVVENAETEYKSLQAIVNRLKSQIAVAQSQVVSSNSNTALSKARLNQTKIIAPCDGKILEWKIQPGEGIIAQQAIAQLAPAGNTIVECEIDESLALKVKVDQLVDVNYLGSSQVIAKGKVYFLSDYLKKKSMFSEQSGEAEDRRVRIVKVMLDNPKGLLFNAKVEVVIFNK